MLLGLILHYVRRDALHYIFRYTPESFKKFWPERFVIRTHIAAAMVMILLGPLQFWTGFRRRYMTLHRWSGRVFLLTGAVAACLVLYMGLHPLLGGVVYGFGLFLNGLFWLAAAAMAYYAIRIGNVQVHKEWMIRTYVLTCAGLVGVRVIFDMDFLGRRIGPDALNDLSTWANWTVPLMVTEIALQIRRLQKNARPRR
ncbi:MAG TPA: DUF2306 domain-containing protein [Candidatus Dormibacteraeota bacterium]|nr:DUF2306 domain-containing protein [Candidatus Dormibacteraeota bacterium]